MSAAALLFVVAILSGVFTLTGKVGGEGHAWLFMLFGFVLFAPWLIVVTGMDGTIVESASQCAVLGEEEPECTFTDWGATVFFFGGIGLYVICYKAGVELHRLAQ